MFPKETAKRFPNNNALQFIIVKFANNSLRMANNWSQFWPRIYLVFMTPVQSFRNSRILSNKLIFYHSSHHTQSVKTISWTAWFSIGSLVASFTLYILNFASSKQACSIPFSLLDSCKEFSMTSDF